MKKVVNLSLRIPETLHGLIEKRAVKDGVTKSDIIRRALIRYFVEGQDPAAGGTEKPADLQGKRKTKRGTPPQGDV